MPAQLWKQSSQPRSAPAFDVVYAVSCLDQSRFGTSCARDAHAPPPGRVVEKIKAPGRMTEGQRLG